MTERISQVGLSEREIAILRRVAESGRLEAEEDNRMLAKIKAAAGFLVKADLGMQWVDFGNKQDSRVTTGRILNERARLLVLGTLVPMIYPDVTSIDGPLERMKKLEVQKTIVSFRRVLLTSVAGQQLSPEELVVMPNMIEFFTRFGAQQLRG